MMLLPHTIVDPVMSEVPTPGLGRVMGHPDKFNLSPTGLPDNKVRVLETGVNITLREILPLAFSIVSPRCSKQCTRN